MCWSAIWWPLIGLKGKLWNCDRGASGWMLGRGSSLRGSWSLEQAPNGSGRSLEQAQMELVTAPTFPAFKILDNAVRHMVWFVGCPVRSQDLYTLSCVSFPTWNILWFYDSVPFFTLLQRFSVEVLGEQIVGSLNSLYELNTNPFQSIAVGKSQNVILPCMLLLMKCTVSFLYRWNYIK